jgi:tetratricopeptide (TPR) repeat protein
VLDDVARLENAQKEYNVILKEALELESASLNSLPQARKAIALCDRALEIYPIGEKAQELLRQAKLRKTELDREFDVRSATAEDEAKKKNYDGAIAALRACHAIDPADRQTSSKLVALLVEYGNILLGQKRPLEAETQFLEALSVEPDSAAAKEGMEKSQDAIKKLQMLAFARYEEALPLIEAGKLEEALAKLVEAVSDDPSNAKYTEKRDSVKATLVERYHRAAAEFESRHEWAKALAEYEKAVALDSRHIDDLQRMQREIEADSSVSSGDGLMQKGRFEEAAEQYKKALDLSARKEDLLKKLDAALKPMTAEAEKLRGEGKYEEALARLDRVAAFNAKYDGVAADAESLRATLARAKERCEAAAKAKGEGRFVACRDALREVLITLPKYPDAAKSFVEAEIKVMLAEKLYEEGARAESGKDYDGAQVKYSASAAAALDFRDSASRAKELLAAKENYEKGEALLAEKKLLAARDAYGAAAAIRKDFKEVQQRISDIETKLAQVETLYTQGVAAQDKKDWDEAISKYEGLLGIIDDYNDTRARLETCKKAKGGS